MTDQEEQLKMSFCAKNGFRTTAKDHGRVGGLLAGNSAEIKFSILRDFIFYYRLCRRSKLIILVETKKF